MQHTRHPADATSLTTAVSVIVLVLRVRNQVSYFTTSDIHRKLLLVLLGGMGSRSAIRPFVGKHCGLFGVVRNTL